MSEPLQIQLNGQVRLLAELTAPVTLAQVVETLGLKADRIAVELNGEIAPRTSWATFPVHNGDKLEIVHFVGGGLG
jgi:sulfur carrier protein